MLLIEAKFVFNPIILNVHRHVSVFDTELQITDIHDPSGRTARLGKAPVTNESVSGIFLLDGEISFD